MSGPIKSRGPDTASAGQPAPVAVPQGPDAPILTYHSLDRSGSLISVSPEAFARHMRRLAGKGFRGVSLTTLRTAWREGANLPAKPVVVTFDDGYANFVDHAAPVLEELGFGATIFAVSGRLGGVNAWDDSPRVARLPLLDGARLRELTAGGFEIGAHSATHRRLTGLSAAELASEVGDSGKRLEDIVGHAVTSFAYPYGAADAGAREAVARTYSVACGVRLSVARPEDDPFELPRLDMYYFRGRASRRLAFSAAGDAYLAVRRVGRGLRHRWLEAGGRARR